MRDERGKFIKGNPGGPGRPPRATEQERLEALHAVVSSDDWREVCRAAVDSAIEGDHRAREWLSKYLLPATDSPGNQIVAALIDPEAARRAMREDPEYIEYLRQKAVAEDETA